MIALQFSLHWTVGHHQLDSFIMVEGKNDYASDSEVRILLASVGSEEFSESDDTSLYSGKDVAVLDNSLVSISSKKVVLKVYKRRWFILGLFSSLSFMQVKKFKKFGIN